MKKCLACNQLYPSNNSFCPFCASGYDETSCQDCKSVSSLNEKEKVDTELISNSDCEKEEIDLGLTLDNEESELDKAENILFKMMDDPENVLLADVFNFEQMLEKKVVAPLNNIEFKELEEKGKNEVNPQQYLMATATLFEAVGRLSETYKAMNGVDLENPDDDEKITENTIRNLVFALQNIFSAMIWLGISFEEFVEMMIDLYQASIENPGVREILSKKS